MSGYAILAIVLIIAAVWLYLLRAIRREEQCFNASMNLDAQRGFVLKRSLSDSARQHQRESNIVRSVLSYERARNEELSKYAPYAPANRLNRGSRQIS